MNVGDYDKALNLLLECVENSEETSTDKILYLGEIAYVYDVTGDYLSAIKYMEQSLGIAVSNSHPDVLPILFGLGSLNLRYGKYKEAKSYSFRALELIEKTLGKDNLKYSAGLSNIAVIYQDIAKYDSSLIFNTKALDIMKRLGAESDPNYSTLISNNTPVVFLHIKVSNPEKDADK